jgi:outer membrane protein OmpA-like peptidoglycan-associated protein
LGKEINTTQDDWGYKVSTDGTFAYFARREKKQFDIYKASLPELLKPDPIGTVYGTLKLPDGKPVNGTVYWTQEGVPGFGHFTTDLEGNYSITIPQDKNYRFYLELPDVYVPPVDIQLKNNQPVVPLKFNPIPIDSIVKTETPFELKNIYFDFDKANLKPNSIEELERFLAFLNANPKIKIKITGHTDAAGTNEYNLQLSEKRAKAVAHYLISRETERSRITYEGVGEAEPDNSNKKISAFNRRVEFRIISNK